MRAIVAWSLRYRLLVIGLSMVVVALGLRAAATLPIDAVPDITNVQVQVLTSAPALSPLDVERTITVPVEAAMSGLPGVTEIRSVSRFGLSAVTIVFEEGTELARARQLVSERLAVARDAIPEAVGRPEMGPMSTGLGEVLQLEIRGEGRSPMELREILDWFVAYELRTVPGVVEVNAFGGELRTFEVAVDPERMAAYGVPLDDLFVALEQNDAIAGGGYLARGGAQTVIRGDARLRTLEEIGAVVVRQGEPPLRVRDVAEVHHAPLIRQGAATRDGRGEATIGMVLMLVGANGREVVERARQRLEEIAPSLPEGVGIDVFYDRAELVDSTIETVAKNLAEGALIVIGVLFLALGSIRGGLIVAIAIPFAMLVAFVGMHLAGVSGNLMSLGAIDFGIVVDGSIIVTEHAVVHLAAAAQARARALTYREAADVVLGSTLEVRRAAMFGELVIVLVYVPILALRGTEGLMFRPMATTVLFALGGAFVASITLVPVLVATFLRRTSLAREPKLVARARELYRPLLARTLHHPLLVGGGAVALVAIAGIVASRMGADFVPELDEGAIAFEANRLPNVSLEESVRTSARIEEVVRETLPEVRTIVCKTGRPEIATDPMGVEQSDCMAMLRPRSEWTTAGSREGLVEVLEERLARDVPGVAFSFTQPIALRFAELLSGARTDVALTIYGDDLDELQRVSRRAQRILRGVAGAADVRGEPLSGLTTVQVEIDRERAGRYGVDASAALAAVGATGGRVIGEVIEGQRRFPLVVRTAEELRRDPQAIGRVMVRARGGALVPLAQIATIEEVDSPALISRESVRRRTIVGVNVRGRDLASFVAEAQERVRAELEAPPGYTTGWGGRYRTLESATRSLAVIVPFTLALVLMVLYAAFGRARPTLLIFLNVPFAAVGGVLLLALRGMPLSISAAVGFIALTGVAVLNGLVWMNELEHRVAAGEDPEHAVRETSLARMRAVLTTAGVAALGFLPMALATSAGAEVQRPLATVVVGGLVTSTLLTLFVLPAVTLFVLRKQGAGAATQTSAGDELPGAATDPRD